jgi:hypothetical protein
LEFVVSEVKTLLKKPDHEIDRMKLSVMHLRLLQEARERIQVSSVVEHSVVLFMKYYYDVASWFCFALRRIEELRLDHPPLIKGVIFFTLQVIMHGYFLCTMLKCHILLSIIIFLPYVQ